MTSQPATALPPAPTATAQPETNGHQTNPQPTSGPGDSPLNGSPPPKPSTLPKSKGQRKLVRLLTAAVSLVAVLGLIFLVGSATGMLKVFGTTARTDLVLHKTQFEHLQLTITERGTLESAENKDVVCRVKARSASSTVATT